jgi:hypothetical protein
MRLGTDAARTPVGERTHASNCDGFDGQARHFGRRHHGTVTATQGRDATRVASPREGGGHDVRRRRLPVRRPVWLPRPAALDLPTVPQ